MSGSGWQQHRGDLPRARRGSRPAVHRVLAAPTGQHAPDTIWTGW